MLTKKQKRRSLNRKHMDFDIQVITEAVRRRKTVVDSDSLPASVMGI